jgi:3D (Asp-Asp-Asp) domain-containing protein
MLNSKKKLSIILTFALVLLMITSVKIYLIKDNNNMKTTSIRLVKSNESSPIIRSVAIPGFNINIIKSLVNTDKHHLYDYVGDFVVTAYTPGEESTGKTRTNPNYGITATGATAKEGITVASDWKFILPGTKIYIESVGTRIIQDNGDDIKGQKLDLYIPDLSQAKQFGVKKLKIYLIMDNNSI